MESFCIHGLVYIYTVKTTDKGGNVKNRQFMHRSSSHFLTEKGTISEGSYLNKYVCMYVFMSKSFFPYQLYCSIHFGSLEHSNEMIASYTHHEL